MTFQEAFGRLFENNLKLEENFLQTLGLLKRIKAGEVDLDKLTLTDDSWTLE